MSSTIRVVAITTGYYAEGRKRVGTEFDLELAHCKLAEDGVTRILPKWVVPASEAAHALIAKRQKAADDKSLAAALYASGNKGRPAKDSFVEAMNEGRGPVARDRGAEAAAIAASGNGASGGASKRKNDEWAEQGRGDKEPETR